MKTIAALAALAVLGVVAGVDAQTYSIAGAERYFRVESDAAQDRRDGTVIRGYLYNDSGTPAANIQLAVDAVDPAGQVTATTVHVLPSMAPPSSRIYFDVRPPNRAATYRIRVLWWEWIRGGG
ncbi:MAG: hypothetical protein HYU51_17570 [Candidatus Rokubacteria bacterium]|nr:hypothetical protein [Candidatus Rokubacteria bacterium]